VPPPGEELFRFATVSDVHIGLDDFAFLPKVRDPLRDATEPPSERCLRAAVLEAKAWGAQLLIVKGDLTEHGDVAEGTRARDLLAPIDTLVLVGNHEVKSEDAADLVPVFGDALVRDVRVHDVPGARLVLFDSTVARRHVGTYDAHADEVIDALATANGPAILLTHHHPMPLRVPHHWPPGIPSHRARGFFERIVAANRQVLMTTGHTHRHRRHDHGPLVITEVGSTQHYPGTWAGYVVHEGGVRQVVRRVAAPDAIAWTEATRRGVLGIWARWSVGRLDERCFSHAWDS
jgi:3',5'-cyclic-AMP phosphodiesterase